MTSVNPLPSSGYAAKGPKGNAKQLPHETKSTETPPVPFSNNPSSLRRNPFGDFGSLPPSWGGTNQWRGASTNEEVASTNGGIAPRNRFNQTRGVDIPENTRFFHRGYPMRNNQKKQEVRQAQLSVVTKDTELTTGGVNTCAVLIVQGETKNALAHVDAKMSPQKIAEQLQSAFTPEELQNATFLYARGANDILSSDPDVGDYAVDNIEAALGIIGLTHASENVKYIGSLGSSFDTIGINSTGTFIDSEIRRP